MSLPPPHSCVAAGGAECKTFLKTRPNRSTRSVDQTQKTCHESDKRFKRDIQYVKVYLEALTNTQKI